MIISFIVIAAISIFLINRFSIPYEEVSYSKVKIYSDEELLITLRVLGATTESQREKGLMNVSSLKENEGMLFVFENNERRSFWMKNTLIPLDLILIDDKYNIVDIILDMKPCNTELCPFYTPRYEYKYAIEINSGEVGKNEIKIGDRVEITSET